MLSNYIKHGALKSLCNDHFCKSVKWSEIEISLTVPFRSRPVYS